MENETCKHAISDFQHDEVVMMMTMMMMTMMTIMVLSTMTMVRTSSACIMVTTVLVIGIVISGNADEVLVGVAVAMM